MKKYGKKWRRAEAEKKIARERMQANAGEPFSSARKKKKRCEHYVIVSRKWYTSLLEPISEEECMCSVCEKRFPIEKCLQMEELTEFLSGLGCVWGEERTERYLKLSQGLEPVYYRRLSETETEILATEEIPQR